MILQHRTPLRKRRPTARRTRSPRCVVRGCKRPQKVVVGDVGAPALVNESIGYCLTHARRKADRLFSLAVRSIGRCQRCGATENLQCSHFIGRRYLGVRYDRRNAECLCYRCHKFLTERPLEAQERAYRLLGSGIYAELRRVALAFTGPLDYASILWEHSG